MSGRRAHVAVPLVLAAIAFGCRPVRTPVVLPAEAPPVLVAAAAERPLFAELTPATSVTQLRGQLHAAGRWLAYPDGSRFRWRGLTGFMLNEQVSSGREADAVAFLAWARQTGFNVVRVLVMLPNGWFVDKGFSPEKGLAALPRTLALAREADMYLEVTVLANTASLTATADMGSYVERVGAVCAAAANCALVEVANETFHRSQRADVHDPAVLARWAARVPKGIPTALGAPAGENASLVAAAPVITIHLDRGPDRWNRIQRMRELGDMSAATNRFVIDNEPLGADERQRPHERDNLPDTFLAQGALSRVFEVGSNFHFEDGLRARVPGPVQQRCAAAFIAGTRIVDDSYMLTFHDAGDPYSPVQRLRPAPGPHSPAEAAPGQAPASHGSVVAAFAGLTQVFPEPSTPSSVLVLIGLDGVPDIEWRQPWQKTGVIAALPQVEVWSIGRVRPAATPSSVPVAPSSYR